LRADQAAVAEASETQAQRLKAFAEEARALTEEMATRATDGGEALNSALAEAMTRFGTLVEGARSEREALGDAATHSLAAVGASAADHRAELEAQTQAATAALTTAAEVALQAADRHAAAAREHVEQLSEAAFGAGQTANKVFEARLEEAEALISESSRMLDEAGAATARKLAEGAAQARAAAEELSAVLVDLETRAARLPAEAAEQADHVRATVAKGLEALSEQSRQATREAEAIDAAFQARVRQHVDTLSQALKVMGSAQTPAPFEPIPPPRADVAEPPGALADRLGLRERIRLTPTATDREFAAVFEAASGRMATIPPPRPPPAEDEAGEGDPWTWKDLLASLEEPDGEGVSLEARILADLAAMDIDPAVLIAHDRLDLIGQALLRGDQEEARAEVRRAAGPAVRRAARRLFTDDDVRARAQVFVRRYQTLIADAVEQVDGSAGVADMLTTPAGRAFLLLDAAGGEML
jgi:hypothetical protein